MALFSNAASIAPAKTGKSAKPAKKEIEVAGLFAYANIDAAIKALEGLKASYEPQVKGNGFKAFMGMEGNSKPESFTGVDGDATASMEMRKRGTNSALKVDEVILLENNGIKPLKEITCRELFAINPKYAADGELLAKVEKALAGIVPDDFIVKQDEISKMVVTDKNVDEVFAAKTKLNKDVFESLVKVVTTQAVKAKLASTNFDNVMAEIAKLLKKDESAIEEA